MLSSGVDGLGSCDPIFAVLPRAVQSGEGWDYSPAGTFEWMRISLHTAAPLALVLALTGALGACGKDSPAGSEASSTPSPSVSTGGQSPSASASDGGTTASEPLAEAPWESAEPAGGKLFEGHGFGFRAPEGWTDATQKAKELNQLVDLAAAAAPDKTGFATNVNVVVADAGVEDPTPDQLEEVTKAITSRLDALVPKLEVNPTTALDGRPTLDHEGAATKAGVNYYIHQYVAFEGRNAYTITFSFSREASPKQRQQVINEVMASWSWR